MRRRHTSTLLGENKMEDDKKDFDLTCWYLNQRRVFELTGAQEIASNLEGADAIATFSGQHFAKMALLSAAKDAIIRWVKSFNPPTLGQLIIADQLDHCHMRIELTAPASTAGPPAVSPPAMGAAPGCRTH